MKKEIIIDGNNFSDLDGFYDEIDRKFTKDLDWKTGHNLDAFNDLIRGGFGIHEYEEEIKVIWKNFGKSKAYLKGQKSGDRELMDVILEIIRDHKHIELVLENTVEPESFIIEKELKKHVRQKGKKYAVALWVGFALYLLGDFFGGQYRDFIVTSSMFVLIYGAWNLFRLRKRLDNRPKEVRKKELKNNSIKRLLPTFIVGILLTNVVLGMDDNFSWGTILFTDIFLLAICLGAYKFMSKII